MLAMGRAVRKFLRSRTCFGLDEIGGFGEKGRGKGTGRTIHTTHFFSVTP
jgi:hypothetical protein